MNSSKEIFSNDGLSSCSSFPERALSNKLESNKTYKTRHSKHKADIGCYNFVEHEIKLEENARRMTTYKSEACRAEVEMLLE